MKYLVHCHWPKISFESGIQWMLFVHDFKHERFKLKCPIMLQFAYFWRRRKISTLIFHFDYIKDALNNRNYNYWLHLSSVRTDQRWPFDLLYDHHSYKILTNWYHLKALDECVSAIIDCYWGFSEHDEFIRGFRDSHAALKLAPVESTSTSV